MTPKEMYQKVQLLKAGQAVVIAEDTFFAVKVPKSVEYGSCELCELDSICRGEVEEICSAMDWPFDDRWYLKLAHP